MPAEIPADSIASMVVASILFPAAVWLLIAFTNKNLKISLSLGAGLGIWYGLIFFLGKRGFFGETLLSIPMIGFGFGLMFFFVRSIYKSLFFQKIFEAIPLPWVLGVQIFRVMGYGFLVFYALGLIPGEFAIPTGVGDMIVGLTAPFVAYLYAKKHARRLAIWWNYLGIGDLALALTLGMSTYPRPFQVLTTSVSNEQIALFPLVMVPLFAVPLSILLHLFTLRSLKKG